MKISFQYHQTDPHADELTHSDATLEEAILIFQSYPWDKEIQAVNKRINQHRTFTTPSVKFESHDGKELTISAAYKDCFFIHYFEPPNRYGDFELSNNDLNNPAHLQPEEFIAWFHQEKLNEVMQLNDIEPDPEPETKIWKINSTPLSVYIGFLLPLPFLFFSGMLVYSMFSNSSEHDYMGLLIFSFALFGLFFYLISWLPISYWWNDRHQEIRFDRQRQEITIYRNNQQFNIPKSSISSAVLVSAMSSRIDLRYIRLKTHENTFVITNYTDDPEYLMHSLGIHFENHEVFFPAIRYHKKSKKERARRKRQSNHLRNEFLDKYQDWNDEQLAEIIRNSSEYAPYALEAARTILNERKNKKK